MKAGWQSKNLAEVLLKTETINPLLKPEVEFEYIDVSSVSNQTFQIEETQQLKGKDAPSRARKLVKTNDILFATIRPTLQRIAIVPEELNNQVCSTGYFVLRPNQNIYFKYLYFYLFSDYFMGQMVALQKGASYPAVTDNEVKSQTINFPPIQEQQRIVAILDEAFEQIAIARANTKKNLQNARALFESHLQSVFIPPVLSSEHGERIEGRGEGWLEKPLSYFSLSISTGPFGSLLHKSDYVSKGVPLVNPINIVDGEITPNNEKQISPTTKTRLQSYVLEEGDIVIGRRGEIGRCAVVKNEQAGWICGTGCFFIRPLKNTNSYFIANLIRSKKYREQLEAASSGATMLNLSNKALSALVVCVPNLQEQERILEKLDALSKETLRLESLYQRKLNALDALKKSLLHKAFAGELCCV